MKKLKYFLLKNQQKFYLNLKFVAGMATCLKDVFIEVPIAIREGNTAILRCDYDLEQEALYTVKWYKGRQEFFRYVPKELPHTRVFPLATINVDVSLTYAISIV